MNHLHKTNSASFAMSIALIFAYGMFFAFVPPQQSDVDAGFVEATNLETETGTDAPARLVVRRDASSNRSF
ncbi:MAG: hypothetical protein ACPGYV_02170 [Phycisphaeraceae bacterium]